MHWAILVACLLLAGCATDPVKLSAQMQSDELTCQRNAPAVIKVDKSFCLTHVTQDRETHERSLPSILGNVIGGVLTTAGTLFVGAI